MICPDIRLLLGRAGGLIRAKLGPGQRYPTDLTAAEWALLEPLLPKRQGPGRPGRVDLRQVLNALCYLTRTGCPWRLLPRDFPSWGTARYYFDQWTNDGTWERLNDALRERARVKAGRQPQPSAAILDSQTATTTEVGGMRGYDAHKKSQRPQAARAGGHVGASPAGAGPRGRRLR